MNEINLQEDIIKSTSEEISIIKEMSLPIERRSVSDSLSDETLNMITLFQDKIIKNAENDWMTEKGEIITKLLIKKNDAEEKLKKASETKDKLLPKVKENEALTKLTEQIKNEESKLNLVQSATKKYVIKKAEYEQKLDFISKLYPR